MRTIHATLYKLQGILAMMQGMQFGQQPIVIMIL